MKIKVFILLSSALILLCSGCNSLPDQPMEVEEEVPVFSRELSPDKDVPYIDDLPSSVQSPSNIPEELLTLTKVRDSFQLLNFEDYEKVKQEADNRQYRSISSAGELLLEVSGPGIVGSIQYTTTPELYNTADDYLLQFISICIAREMTQEEMDSFVQKSSKLKKGSEASLSFEIDNCIFRLGKNPELKTYVITWG